MNAATSVVTPTEQDFMSYKAMLEEFYRARVVLHPNDSPEGLGELINRELNTGIGSLVVMTPGSVLPRAMARKSEPSYDQAEEMGTTEHPSTVIERKLIPKLQGKLRYTSLRVPHGLPNLLMGALKVGYVGPTELPATN